MKYVYILQSLSAPDRYYVGGTMDLKRRFAEHNRGESVHTSKYLPWKLLTYVAFSGPGRADKFEAYLKTASGRAFAKKRF